MKFDTSDDNPLDGVEKGDTITVEFADETREATVTNVQGSIARFIKQTVSDSNHELDVAIEWANGDRATLTIESPDPRRHLAGRVVIKKPSCSHSKSFQWDEDCHHREETFEIRH